MRLPQHYRAAAARETLVPNRDHAYFKGVRQVIALTDYESQPWTVKVPYEGFVLARWGISARRARASCGHGRSGTAGSWSAGSGRCSRIVHLGLGGQRAPAVEPRRDRTSGPGGIRCLFDDVHQGLSAQTTIQSSFTATRGCTDPRHRGVLLWLSWVLGATQAAHPNITGTPVPREAEVVRATGGFLARVLTPAAAARRMFDHFLKRRPWEVLERQPRIAASRSDAAQVVVLPVGHCACAAHPAAQPHGQN